MTDSGPAGPQSPGQHPVPPGPGVAPPFAAPPVEGRTARLWIGFGVAALVVVLCCGGGTAALVGLIVTGTEAINEQAQAVAEDYFDAVSQREYGTAYGLLCERVQGQESSGEFERRLSREPQIVEFQVGDVSVTNRIVVPVDVSYAGGGADNLRVSLAQNTGTGELEVCGIEG